MIAPQLLPDQRYDERRRAARIRARAATQRRAHAVRRRNAATSIRIVAGIVLIFAPLFAYVMLTASAASLNYRVAIAQDRYATLKESTDQLDERIRYLQSHERLADIASRMGMHVSDHFAVIRPVATTDGAVAVGTQPLAFLHAFSAWVRR